MHTQPSVWFATIIDAADGSDDAILVLPDELCDQLNWKIGDGIDISLNGTQQVIVRRTKE